MVVPTFSANLLANRFTAGLGTSTAIASSAPFKSPLRSAVVAASGIGSVVDRAAFLGSLAMSIRLASCCLRYSISLSFARASASVIMSCSAGVSSCPASRLAFRAFASRPLASSDSAARASYFTPVFIVPIFAAGAVAKLASLISSLSSLVLSPFRFFCAALIFLVRSIWAARFLALRDLPSASRTSPLISCMRVLAAVDRLASAHAKNFSAFTLPVPAISSASP